ncbi:6669_t:CDS:10 [Acaulospora morrowiae]|uniref:Glutathione hydrolase n=1 Tax=Acaulospora morrowiae TaxID=94023 RepID=A0A9N9AB84_9GLOM|nr:6669_t:CDS:10 [Acaulospora morrowiae]
MAFKYHSIENAYINGELDQRGNNRRRTRYFTDDDDSDFHNSCFKLSFKEVLLMLLLIFIMFEFMVLSLPLIDVKSSSRNNEHVGLITAKHGAVASELDVCSHIGVDVLKEGGSAVDAAIATELCVGSVNAFSAGIGGGGLMMIRLPNGTVEMIDCRESAPAGASQNMYGRNETLAAIGGLAVGVPGEIRGMKLAHERHGKLPWRRLFEPSIKLCRDGFPVGTELALRLKAYKSLMETDPAFRSIYAPSGRILEEGEMLYRLNFSRSLEIIANNYTEFYEGSIAKSLIREINSRGGIMTEHDFANYQPVMRKPLVGSYRGRKIITSPEPTSGAALLFMLNVLQEYEMSKTGLSGLDLQRIVETIKFGFARRTEMGDPKYFDDAVEHERRVKEIISKEYASIVRRNVSDNHTFGPEYYHPVFDFTEDHGTTHISVVDESEFAVSFTSTINLIWGSQVMDPITGIILNDEMDDFSIPGKPNAFGLWPSPYNFVAPGKRPLSSTVPTIVERNGKFELALGGSGGTRILTAVLQVLLNVYDYDMNILQAISSPRVHQQLLPNVLGMESGFKYELINRLLGIGHVIQLHNIEDRTFSCQVQAVRKFENGTVHAASDFRKTGQAAGY